MGVTQPNICSLFVPASLSLSRPEIAGFLAARGDGLHRPDDLLPQGFGLSEAGAVLAEHNTAPRRQATAQF